LKNNISIAENGFATGRQIMIISNPDALTPPSGHPSPNLGRGEGGEGFYYL
jgi:hypothetical protein